MGLIDRLKSKIITPEFITKQTIGFLIGILGPNIIRICKEGEHVLIYTYLDGGLFVTGPELLTEYVDRKLNSVPQFARAHVSKMLGRVAAFLDGGKSVVMRAGIDDVLVIVYDQCDSVVSNSMLSSVLPEQIRAAKDAGELDDVIDGAIDAAGV